MPRSNPDHLVDAQAAAHYVAHLRGRPCAPGTIWSWATRGHITRHGRGRYDIREIEAWTRRLMMDDLITWLRAQLDEDEQAALRLADGYRLYACDDGHVERPTEMWADGTDRLPNHHNTWLIVYDRAERLAEVEAKRKLLDLHAPFTDHAGRVRCDHCSELCHSRSGLGCDEPADAMYPCPTVSLLAQPYAGRPGWQEAWRA